eukprot:XP_011669537.1 PREDICTED: kappa-type opioid receptor-like [Strongylocentrotus purpuratus]
MITIIPSVTSTVNVVAFKHRAIVAAILLVLALVGLFGNALVIILVIVCRKLRTITNVLVVNLAFADFIACTYLPFQSAGLLSQTGRYPLHEAVCATVAAVGYISVCCSVYTLVAIAFIRWYVITRSIRGHRGLHTPKKIAIMVVIIWIISISFMVVPPVLGIGTLGSRPPMITAIDRKEIEITKNLFMVVCVFMLCFLATIVNFIIPGTSVFTLYGSMISLANSVVNPIIYGLKHPNFQEVFMKIICCRPVRIGIMRD